MNRHYMINLKDSLDRAKQERKQRESLKGDLLVMCVALAAMLTFIVII